MSEIVGLDHVQLAMPAGLEDEARAFYIGVLGLVEEPKPESLRVRGGVWFRGGELRLHLGVEAEFRPARKAHPAILVRDLPALEARCSKAGFTPVGDVPIDGFNRVHVLDPFGNRLELLERKPRNSGREMDLLDRLLGHDAWTTRRLIARCSELADDQLDRRFAIGHRSVRATLEHIIFNMEAWSALMAGVEVPRSAGADAEQTRPRFRERLDVAAARLAQVAMDVSARQGWDEQWLDVLDNPPTEKTYGGAIAHVITHSMHHRAQLLYMLRRLGLKDLPEGDVLSWERKTTSSS